MILCQFIFSELKAPLFIYLFKFFLNIHGFVGSVQSRGFRLEGETIYEGDMRRAMEEVFTYAGFFLGVIELHEDQHKNGCVGD